MSYKLLSELKKGRKSTGKAAAIYFNLLCIRVREKREREEKVSERSSACRGHLNEWPCKSNNLIE